MDRTGQAAAADRNAAKAPPDRAASGFSAPGWQTLRKRADFLRAASARRHGMPGFLLQARRRGGDEADPTIRVGYTCSKKLGNAVTRNRAKRRLRALAREVMPGAARPGWDYVLVGRPGATVERAFADLRADLVTALARIHASGTRRA
ncbi:ribonuclease P protein component [Paracoccus halophilus]|uniref:Ribonuclease P protein component n=1 Tax=Paracoccus halophilus TaxID=376733 RepID=A0A099EYW3_9RHOB|nr:ribonuclease P protein component [Paracoccus halophilus]KGJ03640.1 ribonuclease P [Paracoccus halophilus]SFA57954.1 ribonuclease P protein component [Paracoccus halophilus]